MVQDQREQGRAELQCRHGFAAQLFTRISPLGNTHPKHQYDIADTATLSLIIIPSRSSSMTLGEIPLWKKLSSLVFYDLNIL